MTTSTKATLKNISITLGITLVGLTLLGLVGGFVFDVQSKELATAVHTSIKDAHQATKDTHAIEHKDLKKEIDEDLKDVLKRVEVNQAEQKKMGEAVLRMETRLVREIRKVQ